MQVFFPETLIRFAAGESIQIVEGYLQIKNKIVKQLQITKFFNQYNFLQCSPSAAGFLHSKASQFLLTYMYNYIQANANANMNANSNT